MIRISQIKLPPDHSSQALYEKVQKQLKIKREQIEHLTIVKKSIDARKKPDIQFVYTVDAAVLNEQKLLKRNFGGNVAFVQTKKYEPPKSGTKKLSHRPLIIGAGPAGLFAAYLLALSGYRPIIAERGKKVEERTKDVLEFWNTGVLNPKSNVQFGEGGAGTFSDGKLNTLVKDACGRNGFVLETFVRFGAPKHITYDSRPHIGTDILSSVIAAMREEIIRLGGTFLFESCVTGIEVKNHAIQAVEINAHTRLETNVCIMAPGHSARDTFEMLDKTELFMEPKAFAVGFRVEHPQAFINETQYGKTYAQKLPAAPYKVTANLACGRGVYSFCMCPGGYVVNASSEEKRLAVNGMSYSDRGGNNANSAIIVSVTPDDFDGTDALAGIRYQRILEEKAFALGSGKIPQQLFGDYCAGKTSTSYGAFSSETKGAAIFANLRGLLNGEMEQSFIEGMHAFAKYIPDFDREDAILSGMESRTSSPVRICRDESFQANIRGIYPCGEGAGYAGGITSAAMDGLKAAEAVIRSYANDIDDERKEISGRIYTDDAALSADKRRI